MERNVMTAIFILKSITSYAYSFPSCKCVYRSQKTLFLCPAEMAKLYHLLSPTSLGNPSCSLLLWIWSLRFRMQARSCHTELSVLGLVDFRTTSLSSSALSQMAGFPPLVGIGSIPLHVPLSFSINLLTGSRTNKKETQRITIANHTSFYVNQLGNQNP